MKWPKVGMAVYEAEGVGASEGDDKKRVFAKVRLLRPAPETIPQYWHAVEAFIAGLKNVSFFKPKKDFVPPAEWSVYETRAAAGDAARDAARARDEAWNAVWAAAGDAARARDEAWNAAMIVAGNVVRNAARRDAALDVAWDAIWDVAWNAAWDALLLVACLLTADLPGGEERLVYARRRWEVWEAGYGLLGDDGENLIVYRKA
jgi:hypothetical protein